MLKYLFTVEYKDGTVYRQNPDDISETDKTKSCFFDVKEGVMTFSLEGYGHNYLVDLTDGHFEVDGNPFFLHEEGEKDFRLIFFRRHTHSFNLEDVELGHDVVYRFGWQYTEDGVNHQQVMQIS